jgi:hypothetical protein
MTFREVTPDEVLAALGDGGEDPVLRACVAALRAHPRPSYTIGGSPANAVRETLEVKYRRAASWGRLSSAMTSCCCGFRNSAASQWPGLTLIMEAGTS